MHDVAGRAGAGHAVGVADRDGAARDVVLRRVDAQLVAAVQDLRGEGLVQFPHVDVVDGQAVAGQQLRDREDRADAHFFRAAAGDGHAAIGAERGQAALFSFLAFHQHHGGGAVGQLRSVAGGDELAFLDEDAALEDRGQLLQVGEGRLRTVALVLGQGDFLLGELTGFLVLHHHDRGQRREFGVEHAGGLGRGGALLRLQGVFVLGFAADAVAVGHDLGGLDHRGVDFRHVLVEPLIAGAIAVHLVVLHQADRLQTATDGDRRAVVDDVLGGRGDAHQARGALAVERHARDGVRQAGAQGGLAGDVVAGRTLLQGRAHDHVVDFARIDASAFDRGADHVAAELGARGVVERAAIGLADRGAGCGDDNRFTHGRSILGIGEENRPWDPKPDPRV